jgi:hypothetical protein
MARKLLDGKPRKLLDGKPRVVARAPLFQTPPTLNALSNQSGHPSMLVSFIATATDPDLDALTFSLVSPPWGATITANGQFSWTPTWSQLGAWTITVTVTDSAGLSDTKSCTVSVVNNPPVLGALSNQTGHPGFLISFTAVGHDPDGDPLTYTLVGSPPAGATIGANGQFSWTPTWGQLGAWTITVAATDPGGLSDTKSCTITVANHPPVLAALSNLNGHPGVPMSFTAHATDPDGDPLTYTLVGSPPAGATISANGQFSWTPTWGQLGSWTITVAATDPGGLSDTKSCTITVGNQPPVVTPIMNQQVQHGNLLALTVTATDPDGDPVTFSLVNPPPGATIDAGGHFRWTPTAGQVGAWTVTVQATDPGGLSGVRSFTVTVN